MPSVPTAWRQWSNRSWTDSRRRASDLGRPQPPERKNSPRAGRARRPEGKQSAQKPAASGLQATLLLDDEQGVDFLIGHFLLAVGGVNHEGNAARRHPHQVIAELEHVLDLGLLFQDAEVGLALGPHGHHLHLAIIALIDPNASYFQTIAT